MGKTKGFDVFSIYSSFNYLDFEDTKSMCGVDSV